MINIAKSIEKYPYSIREQVWRQSALIVHTHDTGQRTAIEERRHCKNDEFNVDMMYNDSRKVIFLQIQLSSIIISSE